MRQKTRSIVQSSRSSTKEPLAEGLQFTVPKDSRGRSLWSKITDGQIVEYAKKVMEEKEITGRKELQKTDSGLYSVLKRRRLIDRTFAQLDQQKDDLARDAVIDALEAFSIANDNAISEDEVA
jgi:hypothetical protein